MARERLRLGLSPEAAERGPYARFWRPALAPLPGAVGEALLAGARPPELMPPAEAAADLQAPGDWPVETGWTLAPDGSARVFCRTPMPGVAPGHWAWWFAWHGSEADRYKLWHPQAHLRAAWADGAGETGGYVGRTSRVVEYLGERRTALAIRFVRPAELGLDEARLAAEGQVAICARAGLDGAPVETGAMIHHLRPIPGGCEMRSRFWIFGGNARPAPASGAAGRLAAAAARRLVRGDARQARDLLVHCAQEMNHLAAVLPDLFDTFGDAS